MGGAEEDFILWKEPDGKIQSLKGIIIKMTDTEIVVQRRDGEWIINRAYVIKLQRRGGGNSGR